MKKTIMLCAVAFLSIGNTVLMDGLGWAIQQKHHYAAIRVGKKVSRVYESERCKIEKIEIRNKYLLDGSVGIITIKKGAMDFEVTRKVPPGADFYVNTNFFTNQGPIGEVIIDGERISKKVTRGGFFYVKKGLVNVRKTRPEGVKYACQSIMMGIKGGAINTAIIKSKRSREKIWRGMLGVNKKGDLVVIHSMNMGMISMKQLCDIGVKAGIVNGIVLEGGSSLELRIHDRGYMYEYQPVPTLVKAIAGIHKPFVFVAGSYR
ncbi:phosphodiester glycosidase family protein [Telluribacter sp.]|jgi:hypothetical protein|uniref:phosphodiester glycosidase family protein n=1 Tax=Telluribacter sp. TaxID=1978767 RepID=UPI002E0DC7EE|nr:phosphodiester glycosidase family protein [Telluribacter sp.]